MAANSPTLALSVRPAAPFKEGYHNDYEKWLLKEKKKAPDATHYLNIKRSLRE